MSENRGFDHAMHDWLEAGSDRTPQRAIDAVLLAVKTTPQERDLRIPRRFSKMALSLRLAAAIAIVAFVGVAGLSFMNRGPGPGSGAAPTGSPTIQPTTAPVPPTQLPASVLVQYTSGLYRYTISRPEAWVIRRATRLLNGAEPPWDTSDAVDEISAPVDRYGATPTGVPGGIILVASAQMPADTTLDSWTASTTTAICGTPTSIEDVAVDGEPGRLSTIASCYGGFHQWVTVIHGNTAWHIVWLHDPGTEVADRTFFQQLLATFRFGELPAAAPAPTSPASS